MANPRKVAVLVGSLRKDSFTRKAARALCSLAPEALACRTIEIGDLPLYNADLETDSPPPAWQRFRDEMRACEAVLFATPEYNRSMPGALKNAIDVGSRPPPRSVFKGKPGAVVSVSPGMLGGFGANHSVRQAMVFLDVPMMQMPEAYLGNAGTLFDAEGNLANPTTREFLVKFMAAYAAWVDRILR